MNDRIYIAGGRAGTFPCTSTWYSSVDVYEPGLDAWSRLPNMNDARGAPSTTAAVGYYSEANYTNTVVVPEGCAAVVIKGRLYVIGGSDHNTPLNSVEYYDTALDRWTEVASMHVPRYGLAAVALPMNDTIMVTGGWDGARCLKSAEIYSVSNDRWSLEEIAMNEERMYHAVVLYSS